MKKQSILPSKGVYLTSVQIDWLAQSNVYKKRQRVLSYLREG